MLRDSSLIGIPILAPVQRNWTCPNCDAVHVTKETRPHTPFHPCAGLRGLTAPYVEDGTRCKVEAVDREDYVGKELVQTDGEGIPKMSVITVRDDGYDCAVLAPTATANDLRS